MDANLAAPLDRTLTSPRSAAYMVNSIAIATSINFKTFSSSTDSLRRRRINMRTSIVTDLKNNLRFPQSLVLH